MSNRIIRRFYDTVGFLDTILLAQQLKQKHKKTPWN